MYKCQQVDCKEFNGTPTTLPNQSLNRIITQKRPKTYERTIRRGRQREFIDKIQGWEIVKEISVCPTCYERLTGLKAASNSISLRQIMANKEKKAFKKRKRNFRPKKKNKNSNYKGKSKYEGNKSKSV